jgi:UDP-N-acetyl-D-mannosaminuronate dehydrogenase
MNKYSFKIRARTGMLVDNLTVHGRDRFEAEKKLEQVYRNCEILECREVASAAQTDGVDFESVLSMINRQDNPK